MKLGQLPALALASILLTSFLAPVTSKFFIQFRLDRKGTIAGRIFGNDFYDQPEWRIYSCQHSDEAPPDPKINLKDHQFGVIQCTRFKPGWPRFITWATFYTETNFYETYRALDNVSIHYEFTDTKKEDLPARLWIGSGHIVECPLFYQTPDMLEFYWNRSKSWINLVGERSAQENLLRYLAAPDVSWAYGSPNVTAAYLRAYVAFLGVVVLEYDAYMLVKDQPQNMSSGPLDWRGPAWLDWKLLKPAKKIYNTYRKKVDKMHGLWLRDPVLEKQLRAMIPVLTSKMVDPCFLQDVADYFPNRIVFQNEQFLGPPKDMLCSVYCRYSHAVSSLYMTSSSKLCFAMGSGNKRDGGQCRDDKCYCLKKIEGKKDQYLLSTSLRYGINIFNMKRYNTTHSARLER